MRRGGLSAPRAVPGKRSASERSRRLGAAGTATSRLLATGEPPLERSPGIRARHLMSTENALTLHGPTTAPFVSVTSNPKLMAVSVEALVAMYP